MRKLTYTAFVAFWACVLTLLAVAGLVPAASEPAPAKDRVAREELARHSRQKDCWMAIEGRVYDVTAYLPRHPAPASVVVPWCGRDATEGMRTKGYGRNHSAAAWSELKRYQVGVLAD